jgi:hypothetical protein
MFIIFCRKNVEIRCNIWKMRDLKEDVLRKGGKGNWFSAVKGRDAVLLVLGLRDMLPGY